MTCHFILDNDLAAKGNKILFLPVPVQQDMYKAPGQDGLIASNKYGIGKVLHMTFLLQCIPQTFSVKFTLNPIYHPNPFRQNIQYTVLQK